MLPRLLASILGILPVLATGCSQPERLPLVTFSGSSLGLEGDLVRDQLARFARQHPEVRVELRVTPDSADQRHQLYVQWLNARAAAPDVLQLDVIWTAEFAAAGWIRPLNDFSPDLGDFLPGAVRASRWRGALYAVPWFADVGLLYRRTDLVGAAPRSLDELEAAARPFMVGSPARAGLLWTGARYEGLVTVFLEYLGAFGGGILADDGQVIVDQPPAIEALTYMCRSLGEGGIVSRSALNWREEEVRLAFQTGGAVFMRNWPYAWTLVQGDESAVAGRVAVSAMPGANGRPPTAALGGALLAVNAHSGHPDLAWSLASFLTAPEQMLERARRVAQLPARVSLYDSPELAAALPIPIAFVRQALAGASPRPITPLYSELSDILQVRVHRALSGQQPPGAALEDAANEIRSLFSRYGMNGTTDGP